MFSNSRTIFIIAGVIIGVVGKGGSWRPLLGRAVTLSLQITPPQSPPLPQAIPPPSPPVLPCSVLRDDSKTSNECQTSSRRHVNLPSFRHSNRFVFRSWNDPARPPPGRQDQLIPKVFAPSLSTALVRRHSLARGLTIDLLLLLLLLLPRDPAAMVFPNLFVSPRCQPKPRHPATSRQVRGGGRP